MKYLVGRVVEGQPWVPMAIIFNWFLLRGFMQTHARRVNKGRRWDHTAVARELSVEAQVLAGLDIHPGLFVAIPFEVLSRPFVVGCLGIILILRRLMTADEWWRGHHDCPCVLPGGARRRIGEEGK